MVAEALAANRVLQAEIRAQIARIEGVLRVEKTIVPRATLSGESGPGLDGGDEARAYLAKVALFLKKNKKRKEEGASRWTAEEEQRLVVAASAHMGHHWESVASVVGSDKRPLECLRHYQRSLNPRLLRSNWTSQEDEILRRVDKSDWQRVASMVPGRTRTQCRERYLKSLAQKKKGKWTDEEERRLELGVRAYGEDWRRAKIHVPPRTDAQCREKFKNGLDPGLKKTGWTREEDELMDKAIVVHGCRKWAAVATCVPGRTDAQVFRRWRQRFPDMVLEEAEQREVAKNALPRTLSRGGTTKWSPFTDKPQLDASDFSVTLA
ncbi:hypothetical protein CTAYLR_000513 [Chrysophaeum taylorii]|uniref:Uncharacterized protein n=1 Tax=Chrysophaeum taylorii TaxID=2483200 RepID=A0AAD7XQY8_9STRA|nr:hypothetical protein CTAYLR_000513 [Chrysophaeum taylorii]